MAKILLVEDNELNRDMLFRRLTKRGYDVVVAVNGIEACSKACGEIPDLILMDMHLPELDGWEAARKIKSEPETHTIPMIALTADAMSGDREKAIEAGCDEYETKPVDLQRLLAKIERLLNQGMTE